MHNHETRNANHSHHTMNHETMHGHDKHAGHSPNMFRDRFWISLLLTIPTIIYSSMVQEWIGFSPPTFTGSEWVPFIFGTLVFLYGGVVFIKSAGAEIKDKQPGMMTLISLAIIVAYLYSLATTFVITGSEFFFELTTLISIMLLGHWMEMKSISNAQGALNELAKLLPDMAERIVGTETEKIPVSELSVKDVVMVRPGGKVPADGKVVDGASSVNEAMITGESKPVQKTNGALVIAGTVNESGVLKVEVTRIGEDTALAGIMRLVREAQNSRSKAQVLADKAAFWLTIVALIASISSFLGWLLNGQSVQFSLERAVTVLVVACPHALGLAVPLVTAISTSLAARNGLLIRDRLALEAARNVDVILFDKTGTLTTGKQGVENIYPVGDLKNEDALRIMASVEAPSEHSIAHAFITSAKDKKIKLDDTTHFHAMRGMGVSAQIGSEVLYVGGPRMLEEQKAHMPNDLHKVVTLANQTGKTIVFLVKKQKVLAAALIADIIRPESKEAVQALHALGVRVAMLTGDSLGVAESVAKELGIKEFFAEVLPEHKVDKVKQLQNDGSHVAMVGDGVNDAPALTQANIGIAIGAGTDVAVESADIILIKNDPRDVVKIIHLSQATYAKMVQNLIWATGYNIIAIPLAAGVFVHFGIVLAPAIGAMLMSVSTVIVALNAQLLRRLSV